MCACGLWRPDCGRGLTQDVVWSWVGKMNNTTYLEQVLYPNIAIPRVSGSRGNRKVAQFIKREMRKIGWTIEEDQFEDSTPDGSIIQFDNIVATLDPTARERIVLACHYDSKYTKELFIGATDSAVPCSIMIDTAKKLKTYAPTYLDSVDTTLQFIFFDGEEAFEEWSETDSLYGSRHLASKWQDSIDPNDPRADNKLQNIRTFILLDLIGGKHLHFRNSFWQTDSEYRAMEKIEKCLKKYSLVNPRHTMFHVSWPAVDVEDDHKPFLRQRNNDFPVLHLIAYPYPAQWHTAQDTVNNLDRGSIRDFSRVLTLYLLSEDPELIA